MTTPHAGDNPLLGHQPSRDGRIGALPAAALIEIKVAGQVGPGVRLASPCKHADAGVAGDPRRGSAILVSAKRVQRPTQ
jgi:hypothetical protein